jgi:hypothetical protein
VWLKDADCYGTMIHQEAVEMVAGLADISNLPADSNVKLYDPSVGCGLNDGSSPGEWRLSSVAEWEQMVADAKALNCTGGFAPAITNDAGTHCWAQDVGSNSFEGIASGYYHGGTRRLSPIGGSLTLPLHWGMDLSGALALSAEADFVGYVWPVRGGQ